MNLYVRYQPTARPNCYTVRSYSHSRVVAKFATEKEAIRYIEQTTGKKYGRS